MQLSRLALIFAGSALILISGAATAAIDKSIIKSQEANSALLRGRFDQAIAAFDDALKDLSLPPARQATLYSDRGVAKWRLNQLDAALADFTKAISLNPDYAPAYNNRGNVYFELGRTSEAYKDFDKAVALSPGFGAAYSNRANANYTLKRFDAAEDDFRKAIELMPSSAVPYNGRGKIVGSLGRPYTALRFLNRAIGLNGQYGPAYQNRAIIYASLKRYDEAVADLDKVIALQPDKPDLYVQRGEAYAASRRGPFAFRDFSKAIELNPKLPEALVGRAAQNIDRKRADLALDDLNQAIAIDPKSASAYYWRGQARVTLGDVNGGDEDLTKAIELDSNFADAYRMRGTLRDRAGQRDAAIADLRRALELDPLSKETREAFKTVSGDTADSVVKAIAPAVAGWEVYDLGSGRFVGVNERYPKTPVMLEMQGSGQAEILEWTPLSDTLAGLGLLRYSAGEKQGGRYEYVAIIDISANRVVAIEPYLWGELKSRWNWTQTTVAVTDPEGLTALYELRKPKPVEPRVANDDFFGFGRRGRRGLPDFFGWLFR